MDKNEQILETLDSPTIKLGEIRKLAKEIKKDHTLAMELWHTGKYKPRQLAILIMDKNLIDQKLIDALDEDIQIHSYEEKLQLADWLMANQLMKGKKTVTLIDSWQMSESSIQRHIFWYYQARLRWTGQESPENTEELLTFIEQHLELEAPEVQWTMNFLVAQIGIYQEQYRARCVQLGERVGLYKDEKVAKNCTPNYLPEFIRIQVAKLK
ncbi:DNA alkylation repair protein [Enterococcus sp. LJL99]